MPGPLSGIRVLDLSRVLAGPWAGQVFADLGAEVIKIERPGVGDDTRAWGPPFAANGLSAYFCAANRGKKSVTVDIATPEGQDIIARNYFRPRDQAMAAKYSARFPAIASMATIADFGGWSKAQADHFSDGGTFDRIYGH